MNAIAVPTSTPTSTDSASARRPGWLASLLASRPGLLGLVGVNLAVQLALYLRHESRLLEVVLTTPSTAARVSFFAWIVALLGTFAVSLLALGWLEARVWPRRRWLSLAVPLCILAETVLLVTAFADMRLVETMGLHLYDDVVVHAANNPGANRELHLDGASTMSMLGFSGAILLGQIAVFAVTRRVARWQPARRLRACAIAGGLLFGIVATGTVTAALLREQAAHASDYLEAAPFYRQMLGTEPFKPVAGAVHYPIVPADGVAGASAPSQRPDVLFVLTESLRADAFTDELMPQTTAWAEANGCLTSQRHYSGAHTTEYGTFNLLYGVHGYHYEPFARDGVDSWPLQVLARAGYRLTGASASSLEDWNGGGFMFRAFDSYREYLDTPADVGDREVVEQVLAEHAASAGRPTFSFAFFNSTHHNYLYPAEWEIDTPVLPSDYDHFMGDDALAEQKTPIRNRYRNSVRYVDALFAELAARYVHQAGDDAIVVFTGDHGEEFWEHGLLGHGAPRFNEERVRVPLMVCLPGAQRREPVELSSHVDVLPTVLEHVGFGEPVVDHAALDGTSLLRERPADRPVWLGGLDVPWDAEVGAFVDGEHKFWVRLCAGESLCLEPWRVTDLDDAEVPIGTRREALRGYIGQFTERFERFVAIE